MKLELKDKIPEKLHTLFVGINPAIRSAKVGHYYAHPTNAFWKLLTASRISPFPVTSVDDDMLVLLGFGFTDVAKRPTVGASDLEAQEFEQARERLTALIIAKKPRTVVFVSKVSARAFLGEGPNTQIKYGQQTETYHGATIWFVPSTSGQSYADTTYEEKLALFRQLSKHIKTYFSGGEAVSPSISSPALQASASRRFFGRQTSLA